MKRSYKYLVFGIATLSCGFASSALVAADDTQFTVTVNPYLNVTLSDSDIHLPITPTSAGTYGDTYFTATASTNNAYGYKLNLSIKDGSAANANLTTDLKSNVTNVNTGVAPVIPTFSTNDVLTSSEFSASTSTDHINHWAMSINDTDHYQKVLSESTIATSDSPAIDDPTTINLATKLDLLTSPGSYSAYFNFAVVANPVPPESNPINTAMGNANKQPVTINDKSYYKIQDMSTSICGAITTPAEDDLSDIPTTEMIDIRDNTIYTVGKLADGRCWMLDNLALDLVTARTNITTSNTNANAAAINALFNGGGTSSNEYANTGVTSWDTNPVPSYSNHEIYGNTPLYYTSLKNNTSNDSNELESVKNVKFGIFYNYCAASAGSYCYGNETDESKPTDVAGTAIDSPYDICPAGWRMPTGDTYDAENRPEGGEIQALYDAYDGDGYDIRAALRLPLTGNYEFRNYSEHDQNNLGYFWTSTWYSSQDSWLVGEVMYIPYIFNNNVYPNNYGNRFSFGFPVRCIAK